MAAKRRLLSANPRRGRAKRRRMRRRRKRIAAAPVPRSKIVKFRYVSQIALNPIVGTAAVHVFRAASMFDPDLTGVGHQPYGHDQWKTFYEKYMVTGAILTATFISTSDDALAGSAVVGIELSDDSSPITVNPTLIMEKPGSTHRIVTAADAKQKVTVRKGFSTRRFFSLKDLADNRDEHGSNFGFSPLEEAYWHVYVTGINSTVNTAAFDILVKIEYTCQLTEPKDLAES